MTGECTKSEEPRNQTVGFPACSSAVISDCSVATLVLLDREKLKRSCSGFRHMFGFARIFNNFWGAYSKYSAIIFFSMQRGTDPVQFIR